MVDAQHTVILTNVYEVKGLKAINQQFAQTSVSTQKLCKSMGVDYVGATTKASEGHSKFSSSMTSTQQVMLGQFNRIKALQGIESKGIPLSKAQQTELGNLRKSYQGYGGDLSKLTGKHKPFLEQLTRARWVLVNLAMGAALVYAAFKTLILPSIELETAMANVRKTTNMTAEEIKVLRKDFIELSLSLPMSAKELAEIGAVAGQLGIRGKENILAFTNTVALLSIVTELTAEDAAKALGKISNAFNLPMSQVNKLGSVINELSNTTAANATEIVSALVRIGAAGANLGVTVDFAAALSATLIDAGLRAERAGTRTARALIQIVNNMDAIAKALPNLDIRKFAELVEIDANQAILLLAHSFANLTDKTEAQIAINSVLGVVGGQVFQTLSGNVSEFEKNLKTANDEFENGYSLLEEYSKQVGTTANQWKLLSNQIKQATLSNEGWVNSMIRAVRLRLVVEQLRKEKGEEWIAETWVRGISKEEMPTPKTLGKAVITPNQLLEPKGEYIQTTEFMEKATESLKEELAELGVYTVAEYNSFMKIIDAGKEVGDRYDMITRVLFDVQSTYQMLVGELDTTLDNLDEENEILPKNSEEWKKNKNELAEINRNLIAGNPLTAEQIKFLKELNTTLEGTTKLTGNYANVLDELTGTLDDFIRGLEGKDLGTKILEALAMDQDIGPILQPLYSQLEDFFSPDLLKADALINQIKGAEEALKSEGKTIDDWLRSFGKTKAELDDFLQGMRNAELAERELKDATDELNYANKELQRQLDDVGDSLSNVRDRISGYEQEIRTILGRRWKISGISETEIGHLISQQELELNRARFATYGLGTAEEFLRNASILTADGINEQTDAIQKLIKATETGEDRYDAWKNALQETIRALLISSQDIDRDVTDVVRKAQTELLSITQFDRRGGDQFTAMEANLDFLGQAQDIFFGDETEKLKYSEMLREDRINGMNLNAAQAISNLENERTALGILIIEEEYWINQQESIREQINLNREAIDNLANDYDNLRDAANAAASAQAKVKGGGTQVTIQGVTGSLSGVGWVSGTPSGVSPWQFKDFVSRPGQPMQNFSPQDTIVGIKDTDKIGGKTINNVNVVINGGKFNEKTLATEIYRQIKSLA